MAEKTTKYLGAEKTTKYLCAEKTTKYLGAEKTTKYLGAEKITMYVGAEKTIDNITMKCPIKDFGAEIINHQTHHNVAIIQITHQVMAIINTHQM